MAKGNMLLGYARGKVGSLVFARRKGEQITRTRNTAPTNPRTNAQMGQRMKMYAPVQLYRQSMRAFFKFAFEVAPQETIFNAYMRENISIAPWVPKQLVAEQAPIPFPARMSSGNVAGFLQMSPDMYSEYDLGFHLNGAAPGSVDVTVKVANAGSLTLGTISQGFLAKNASLKVGDQITFVVCHTAGLSADGGNVSYDGVSGFNFRYAKFKLDPNSLKTPEDVGLVVNGGKLSLVTGGDYEYDAVGGCIIVTRNDGSKIVASNSTLALNEIAAGVYNTMRTAAYREMAALTYKASDDAYLNPATTEI